MTVRSRFTPAGGAHCPTSTGPASSVMGCSPELSQGGALAARAAQQLAAGLMQNRDVVVGILLRKNLLEQCQGLVAPAHQRQNGSQVGAVTGVVRLDGDGLGRSLQCTV